MQIISNQYLTLSVSEEGAEARSIIYKGEERLYQGDQGWKRRSPILFPWAGRLRNLTYTYDGVAYSLPQHGFARDHILEVTEKKEDSVTFRLLSDENTLLSYPRAFALYVTYRLEGNTLRFSMAVENRSGKEMVFGIGVHPGFILRGGEERLEIKEAMATSSSWIRMAHGMTLWVWKEAPFLYPSSEITEPLSFQEPERQYSKKTLNWIWEIGRTLWSGETDATTSFVWSPGQIFLQEMEKRRTSTQEEMYSA